MTNMGKATGRGGKGGGANIITQAGKGSSMMRKQQGTQGQGGGLITPPHAPHCST